MKPFFGRPGKLTSLNTLGFLYGAGAEILMLVTGASRENLSLGKNTQKQLCIPRKPRETEV